MKFIMIVPQYKSLVNPLAKSCDWIFELPKGVNIHIVLRKHFLFRITRKSWYFSSLLVSCIVLLELKVLTESIQLFWFSIFFSRTPEQCPSIVSLLSESYNPHVRYGAAMALGIACAGTGIKEALSLLEPMVNDSVAYVRQG